MFRYGLLYHIGDVHFVTCLVCARATARLMQLMPSTATRVPALGGSCLFVPAKSNSCELPLWLVWFGFRRSKSPDFLTISLCSEPCSCLCVGSLVFLSICIASAICTPTCTCRLGNQNQRHSPGRTGTARAGGSYPTFGNTE